MTDEQTGEVSKPAEAPAQEVPASESSEKVVDQQPTTEPESTESETVKNEVADDAPKDNKAWAAMRVQNKILKEALDSVDPEYLEKLRGASRVPEYQPQEIPQVTPDTDYSEVTNRVNLTQAQVVQANQRIAQLQNQLELQQDRQAEDAYPELKTDKVFQQIVAEKKLAARVLGHERTTLEIAREVKNILGNRDQQLVVKTAEATKQEIREKQAATAEAKGRTSAGKSSVTDEDLRMRVRKGDQAAQVELAKRIMGDLEV